MNKFDYTIRLERKEERREVENLVRNSFWNVYRPGCLEHYVLSQMRSFPDFIQELNFVMEKGGKIIGQNVFVRAFIKSDDGRSIPVAAMGPICIAPGFKRRGYGKILLDYTLEEAKKFGIKAICLEGNSDFYGKSGFDRASKFGIRYHDVPEGEDAPFFLCKELEGGYLNGITGEYTPPNAILSARTRPRYSIRLFRLRKSLSSTLSFSDKRKSTGGNVFYRIAACICLSCAKTEDKDERAIK